MPDNKIVTHAAFVLLLPIIVAFFGLSVWSALLLVVVALLWRWAIVLAPFVKPSRDPGLVLETISASHFVEKVRWSLDRLGVDYTEQPCAGTLGAYFLGRTVPLLTFRTGFVRSRIGNSAEILRYLWGAYAATLGPRAAFLEPTAERLELERRIDRCGANLQVWVYYHLLSHPELCKRLWGARDPATPWWQRKLIVIAFPLQAFFIRRTFRISGEHYGKSMHHIEELLDDVETRLADGRSSILGGSDINYTDIAFAAISGLWLQPEGYGGEAGLQVGRDQMPNRAREDIERWIQDHPRTTEFVENLYAEERRANDLPDEPREDSKE